MAYFTVKTNPDEQGERYEVPRTLTYGEQIDIFKELGEDAAALGVIWIAIRRRFPQTTIADLRDATVEMFEDEEDKLPPTYFAAGGSSEANGKPTEPADTGNPGSESTTA
jgi:hypothetical protein